MERTLADHAALTDTIPPASHPYFGARGASSNTATRCVPSPDCLSAGWAASLTRILWKPSSKPAVSTAPP